MRRELTRGQVSVIAGAGAVVFGLAGGLGLGPLWAIAGVLAGPPIAFVAAVVIVAFAATDPATSLRDDEPERAIAQLHQDMPGWRRMARIWPGQFRDTLANRLVVLSAALQAVHRDAEALGAVEEAVALYQDLAAARPGKFALSLADALERQALLLAAAGRQPETAAAMTVAVRLYRNLALTDPGTYLRVLARCLITVAEWLSGIDHGSEALEAANEAVSIYLDRLPADGLPPRAAQALLCEGRLLCGQARYGEAARPLAKGWQLAASHHRPDLLQLAIPAVKAAYRADKDSFLIAWRTETGDQQLPSWLTH
jgi:tetratricopeptide (TPR) repeat protein